MRIAAEKYFPFENVAQVLSDWGKEIGWLDDGIAWPTPFGSYELVFVPGGFTTLDGMDIAGHIECRHMLLGEIDDPVNPYGAAIWNRHASLSALLPAQNERPPTILARASIFEGDSAAVNQLYAPMLATEAYMQPMLFAAISGNSVEKGPGYFNLSNAEAEPPYGQEEFEIVQQMCEAQGCYSNAGAHSVVVEFPWDPGAYSAGMDFANFLSGDESKPLRTSLCKITTAESHPHLGRGLLATLTLPLGVQGSEDAARIATQLNQFEATSVDMPPFMGAWCIGQGDAASFVMFVPNELCVPGLPRNIMGWMGHRARRVPRWFDQMEAA